MDIGTPTPPPLSEVIRQAAFLRGEERRPQRWLAQASGIHESDISRIVNGMDPGAQRAHAIAEALEVSVTDCGWPQHEQAQAA